MSVLKQVFATPSRVKTVYHYLLHTDGQEESRERLEAVLSPPSIFGDESRNMIRAVVNECVKMELLEEDEAKGRVRLHPKLTEAARDIAMGLPRLPVTLTDLFLRGNGENRDLALVIAWYLAQDVLSAPGDWESTAAKIGQQVGDDKLGLGNSNPYNQFDDWACFLGFAWHHGGRKELLTPDPTQHLRWRLPEIFVEPRKRLTPAQAMERLAEICPVFEGGDVRREVEERMRIRRERELSSVTSFAWFRLRDEGRVEVESTAGDAEIVILSDAGRPFRCTGFTWIDASVV